MTEPLRVLAVVTAPLPVVTAALDRIRRESGRSIVTTWLVSPRDDTTSAALGGDAPLIRCPASRGDLLRLIRTLRRQAFDRVVVVFDGRPEHRRIKFVSLAVGGRQLLIVRDAHTSHVADVRTLSAQAGRVVAARLHSAVHPARSAWRLLRSQGLSATIARARLRAGARLNRSSRLVRWRQQLTFRPTRFTSPEDCDVSIVIPAHNHWAATRRCLRSIAVSTDGPSFEVVLVDDASTDRTRAAATRIDGLRVVGLDQNRGFIDACNAGAAAARGRFVLFLNNDTVVTPGWLPAMVRVFDEHADCGAVGARLLHAGGALQEAGGIVWRDGTAWNFGNRDDPDRPEFNYVRRTDYCSGAALLVRRDVFTELGGFDRRYAPAYWEDVDLCFRLADRGLSVWYQPAATIFHEDGLSSTTAASGNVKRYQDINAATFRDRWQTRLKQQEPFADGNFFRAADRNRGPIVLIFDHYVPTPDRDAGSVFMDRFVAELARQDYRVVFWPSNLFRWPGYTDVLQQRGVEVIYGPADVATWASQTGGHIDYAIAYRAPVAAEQLPRIQPFADVAGYIAVDLESLREMRRCAVTGEQADHVEALIERERAVLGMADVVGVHSTVEQDMLNDLAPAIRAIELPLPAPELQPGAATFDARSGFVFVGSTHPPNVDGLRHFVATSWPDIRRQLGDVRLRVVGDVCRCVPELARTPGVELAGHVPDLTAWLDRSRVFVSPLRYGAGLKGKNLAALRSGLPLVTTPVGAEGLGLEDRVSALVPATDDAFSAAVVELHTNQALWEDLRRGGLALATARHGSDRFETSVRTFMSALDEARRGRATSRAAAR